MTKPCGKRCFEDYVSETCEKNVPYPERRPSKYLRLTEDAALDIQPTYRSEKGKNTSSWLWLSPEIHPMFSERKADHDYRAQEIGKFLRLAQQVHPQYVAPAEGKNKPMRTLASGSSHNQSQARNSHLSHGIPSASSTLQQRPPAGLIPFDPVWWWPDMINKDDFHNESGLLLVGSREKSRAGIVPTYELFCAIIKAGLARRDADSSYALRNHELDEVQRKYDKMVEEKAKCEEEQQELIRLTSSNYGGYDRETFEWAMKRKSEVIYRIRALEAEGEELQVEQDNIYARHHEVNVNTMAIEKTLWDLLDDLLVRIGVLPNIDGDDKDPRVRIIDTREHGGDLNLDWPENNWNDEIPEDWIPPPIVEIYSGAFRPLQQEEPESTWNNAWNDYPRNENLLALKDALRQTADEATRVEKEFNNVREQYDQELKTYMFYQRGKRVNASVRSYQLEEEFGPIWLEKCRKISSKMQEADRGYAQAECDLSDARRHDREVRRRKSKPELGAPPAQTKAIATEHFGERMSSRKRRWIDEWLGDVCIEPRDEDQEEPREEPGQPITVAMDEASRTLRSEDVPMATGQRRRTIDRYVLRTQELRQDTTNTALQQLHLDWARKVGEGM